MSSYMMDTKVTYMLSKLMTFFSSHEHHDFGNSHTPQSVSVLIMMFLYFHRNILKGVPA